MRRNSPTRSLTYFLLFPLLLLFGCGGGQEASPTDGLTLALQAYQEQDDQKAYGLMGGSNEFNMDRFKKELQNGFRPENSLRANDLSSRMMALISDFTYQPGGETIEGASAIVQVEITYTDLAIPVKQTLQDLPNAASDGAQVGAGTQELETLFLEGLLRELEGPQEMRTETLQVRMIRTEDTWHVDPDNNDPLLNALTGNLSSL